MLPGITESLTFDLRDYLILAGAYLILILLALQQVLRARRLHYVGRIPDATYRARVVEAVFPVVFLPIFVLIDRSVGAWGSLVLGFAAIGVAVWVDETKKES